MKRRNLVLWAAVLVALLLIGFWLLRPPAKPEPVAQPAEHKSKSGAVAAPSPPNPLPPTNPEKVVQPPPRTASEAEKWAWWRAMSEKDRFFEYKMPISFYGQVVDESGAPIAGATIRFTWTDLSNEGTSKRES